MSGGNGGVVQLAFARFGADDHEAYLEVDREVADRAGCEGDTG